MLQSTNIDESINYLLYLKRPQVVEHTGLPILSKKSLIGVSIEKEEEMECLVGGGAYRFSNLIKEKLGVSIEKEEEMECLVAGANFLLKVGY